MVSTLSGPAVSSFGTSLSPSTIQGVATMAEAHASCSVHHSTPWRLKCLKKPQGRATIHFNQTSCRKHSQASHSPTALPPGLDLVPTSRHSYWLLKVSYHFKCSSTFFKAPCCFKGPSWPSAYHVYIHTGETGRLGRHGPSIKGLPLLTWD